MARQEVDGGIMLSLGRLMIVAASFIPEGLWFLINLPMTRPLIAKGIVKHLSLKMSNPSFNGNFAQHQPPPHSTEQSEDTIEGEFERKDKPPENSILKDDLRKPK